MLRVIVHDLLRLFLRYWVRFTLLAAASVWFVVFSWPNSQVQIIFCNAGQGDETLIQRGFTQILLDSGPPGRALDCLSKHLPFFDRTIELMVVTHPELDHYGGAEQVLERYTLMHFVYNGFGSESSQWVQLSKKLREKRVSISLVSKGDDLRIGEIAFKVLWPKSLKGPNLGLGGRTLSNPMVLGIQSSRNPNADAIVLAMTYRKFTALFPADIGEKEEEEIIQTDNLLTFQPVNLSSVSVLKVPHHGSKYSSSQDFLQLVKPRLAVIEVGKNSYGHPTRESIERLEAVGAQVMRTDQDGDVIVETDGEKWKFKSQNSKVKSE